MFSNSLAGVAVYYAGADNGTQQGGSEKRPVNCILIAFSQDSLVRLVFCSASSKHLFFVILTGGRMFKA